MRVRVHRGAAEIGGNCIELEASDGSRLVLDVGRPVSAGWDDEVSLPPVAGLFAPDPSLLGVIVSHPHLDHPGTVRIAAGVDLDDALDFTASRCTSRTTG